MDGTPIDNIRYNRNSERQPSRTSSDDYTMEYAGDNGEGDRSTQIDLTDLPEPRKPTKHVRFQQDNNGIMSKIPEKFREPLIIVVIYVVLSFPTVRQFFAKYLPRLNEGDENSLVGLIVYGCVFATIFTIARYFLLSSQNDNELD